MPGLPGEMRHSATGHGGAVVEGGGGTEAAQEGDNDPRLGWDWIKSNEIGKNGSYQDGEHTRPKRAVR